MQMSHCHDQQVANYLARYICLCYPWIHGLSVDFHIRWVLISTTASAQSGLKCFVVHCFHSYANKLQNGKSLILSATYKNQRSHLWNNHCKDLRIYYTNRNHTAKASWNIIDSSDKNVNDLTWPQTDQRFLGAWQNGYGINNRTTIRRGPEMTFSVPEPWKHDINVVWM